MTNANQILSAGRQVVRAEAEALAALEASLGQDFVTAVNMILNCDHHVILVGIGKSGHIARKIAASFASTGTPSFFLHPSEAAHGDLGMINAGSVIVGLSNSGESAEVNAVLDYAKSLGNKTIAITMNPTSTLAKTSDVALNLPASPEACPQKLAPTTSTTLTLAMGDALCVAVMDVRGFTAEDFGRRHPAGKLGFGLKRIAEYLTSRSTSIPTIASKAEMSDVILAITSGGKGCVGIVDDGRLKGIVTDGDLRRAMSPDIMSKTAADIMTKDPFTLSPDIRIKDAIAAFSERKIGNAFVVEGQDIVGLIDLKTLLATGYV